MFTLNCKGRILAADRPVVMGIINVTPDSFYSGSRFRGVDAIRAQAAQMLADGAAILDIGGMSTRPGSAEVSVAEETDRVCGPIEAICREFPQAFISIDTYRAAVAEAAVASGASIINDISAGKLDPALFPMVAKLRVPYVLMHMQGKPATMQLNPQYDDVTKDILAFFIRELAALNDTGVHDIILDPGFGFGKTIAHNFQLLQQLKAFQVLPHPLLLGVSRKSFIAKTLGVDASASLNGTTAVHMAGLMRGASLLRVHDVKEAVQTIQLAVAAGLTA